MAETPLSLWLFLACSTQSNSLTKGSCQVLLVSSLKVDVKIESKRKQADYVVIEAVR